MSVIFNKNELDVSGRNYTIKFNNQSNEKCQINDQTSSNIRAGSIWIEANYNECGIKATQDGTNIVYNQKIVIIYGKNKGNDLIQRQEKDEYNIRCIKARNFTRSADVLNVTRSMGRTTDKGKKNLMLIRPTW